MAIIDMKTMRYINLLDKISHVKTSKCFIHNNSIFFVVNKNEVSKAIGAGAVNVRKIQEKTGRKIKIIEEIYSIKDIKNFIEDIISPVKVKSVDLRDNLVAITAGSNQNKAAIIGRDRRREEELNKVIHDYFNMNIKII